MKKIILPAAAIVLGLQAGSVLADTFQAKVFIQETISITETTEVDFGSIPNTDGTCTMSSAGVLSGTCTGTGTTGAFSVAGSANQSVTVAVSPGVAVDGVTFTPVLTTPTSTTLDGSGSASVGVTGSMALSSATSGQKAINYTLTVNYD